MSRIPTGDLDVELLQQMQCQRHINDAILHQVVHRGFDFAR
jgi:hypothetical protein